MKSATFVVVGGGIAGVTCAEHLCYLSPNHPVILISASPLVKSITNIVSLTKTLFTYDVVECEGSYLKKKHANLEIVYDKLSKVDSNDKIITTEKNEQIRYEYLCICTGGKPNIIPQAGNNPNVIGIRDTTSVKDYQRKISNARRVVVVGNGGIASELVYATKGVEMTWVIKDKHISSTFIDAGAAHFFQSSSKFTTQTKIEKGAVKRHVYSEESDPSSSTFSAAALGPDWLKNKTIEGVTLNPDLKIILNAQVEKIMEKDDKSLSVLLSNRQIIETDIVVSATGVTPSLDFECDAEIKLGPDNGIAVNWRMETNVSHIFAAGDVCFADWDVAKHWFQMRLWTQAYQMGAMAAKSMHAYSMQEEVLQDFCFELFSHTTKLFGYQVVLLGKFNGQGLGKSYEILLRSTPNLEYIKFVLVGNKLQGVILIGETGLEETCENLILNQIDLSPYGDDILNPDIDIEDYFD